MKKILLVLVIGFTLLLTGCGKETKVDYEKIWQGYAKIVVEQYAFPSWDTGYQFDDFVVTMTSLKNINTYSDGTFDLEAIKSCSDDSTVTVEINKETKTITGYKYSLNCQ